MSNTISIDIVFNAVNKAMPAINKLNQGFGAINGNLWKVNQAAEAWSKTSQTVDQISRPFQAYNQGLAEMESITGITGSELKELGKNARKTGIESGLGASGSIEAYKLLASNIDVATIGMEGLNKVHKDTLTLAATSKELGLSGAATALAGTLNQYNLAASESGRVMNVLAAGAKYGAAEVPDLTQSFKVAGAAAAAAGLSVEQTGGAIEVLSKMNIKGSEAGTALRNVLLKMQTDLGFDFKVTKLSDALKTLQGREGDAAYMAKIFGAENIAAAQFMVKNADEVDKMTEQMTGTTVATEQAAIMEKTFTHWLDVKKARLNDVSIAFFQHNEGLLKAVTGIGQLAVGATSMLPLIGGVGKGFTGAFIGAVNTGKAMRLMSAAMAAGKLDTYSALISRYGAAGKIASVGLKISTIAQGAWNAVAGFTTGTMVPLIASTWAWTAALLANPVTWIVVGVAALIAGLALAWKHFDGFRGAVVGAWEGIKQFGVILWQAIINPLKQIISGIGAVGKAIGLMFKGKFGEAAATAKEGFANIAEGAVKSSPIGVAVQVANRRQEIVDKSAAGYRKGKAIDTSNFLSSKKKVNTDETQVQSEPKKYNPSFNLPKQGLSTLDGLDYNFNPGTESGLQTYYEKPKTNADLKSNLNEQNKEVISTSDNAYKPSMKVVKSPGIVDPMKVAQPVGVTVPAQMAAMDAPSVPFMNIPGQISATVPTVTGVSIPGTINAAQPNMKVVKSPGIVDPINVPQPAGVTIPAAMAMDTPSVPFMNIPGKISATTSTVPGVNIPGTIDAAQPEAKPINIPGNVILNVQNIQALNFLEALNFATPEKINGQQATMSTGNIVDLTKNFTENIQKNETTNNQANITNNDSQSKIQVTYSPVINISSTMDQRATDDLMKMLADNKDELMKLINEEMRRNNRLRYAG
jgi:TP901 family phage tail tape measure protein